MRVGLPIYVHMHDTRPALSSPPGGKPRMWRRAWRDKILPALYNFK